MGFDIQRNGKIKSRYWTDKIKNYYINTISDLNVETAFEKIPLFFFITIATLESNKSISNNLFFFKYFNFK